MFIGFYQIILRIKEASPNYSIYQINICMYSLYLHYLFLKIEKDLQCFYVTCDPNIVM